MKHCFIRASEESHLFHDSRYIEVMLCEDDEGTMMCHLSGVDDWELSFSGPDAEAKFDALLDVTGDVTIIYILELGFTQHG